MDEYVVTINGVEHTMMLSQEDAERYGDNAKKSSSSSTAKSKASAPSNKARS